MGWAVLVPCHLGHPCPHREGGGPFSPAVVLCWCSYFISDFVPKFLITTICQTLLISSLDLAGMERDVGQCEASRVPCEPRAHGDTALCMAAATVSLGTQGAGTLPMEPGGSLQRLLTINHSRCRLGRECWHGTARQREPPLWLQLAVPGHTRATSLHLPVASSSCSALTHSFIMVPSILSLFTHTDRAAPCSQLPLPTPAPSHYRDRERTVHISSPARLTYF